MDIRCVVCGEPWDAWGIAHGDMLAWETDAFRAGAGCPSCEGRAKEPFEPETIFDIENGDDDPVARLAAYERRGTTPWTPPAPTVEKACGGCGVQLIRDLAAEVYDGTRRAPVYAWSRPRGARVRDWYVSHSDRALGDPEDAMGHDWHPCGPESELSVCPCCVGSCADCGAPIYTVDGLAGDVYDRGACFLRPGSYRDSICVDCLDHYCSECGADLLDAHHADGCSERPADEDEDNEDEDEDEDAATI